MSEFSVPQTAGWDNPPTRRELTGRIDQLAVPADAKVLLGRLMETTADVGSRIIEIGRRILAFVLEMARRYPATAFGTVIGFTLTVLIGSIPFLGPFLGPLFGSLLTALLVTQGALDDMRHSAMEREIDLLVKRVQIEVGHA